MIDEYKRRRQFTHMDKVKNTCKENPGSIGNGKPFLYLGLGMDTGQDVRIMQK